MPDPTQTQPQPTSPNPQARQLLPKSTQLSGRLFRWTVYGLVGIGVGTIAVLSFRPSPIAVDLATVEWGELVVAVEIGVSLRPLPILPSSDRSSRASRIPLRQKFKWVWRRAIGSLSIPRSRFRTGAGFRSGKFCQIWQNG